MFRKYGKGAETPRFRRGSEPPRPSCRLRPCLADGKPATFHRWADEDKALLQINAFLRPEEHRRLTRLFHEEGVASNAATIEKLRTCFALVEYPDGSVGKVKPELIQFLDRKEQGHG